MHSSTPNPLPIWSRIPTGYFFAAPIALYLVIFFVGPMVYVIALSFMPQGATSVQITSSSSGIDGETTSLAFSFDNYLRVIDAGYHRALWTSVKLALFSTSILLLICYPLAYGLSKTFGRLSPLFTLLFLMPLFVSETIRLYGWSLFFLKGGILNGILSNFGLPFGEMMFTTPVIIVGLVNIYFPFMLFPLVLGISLIDDTLVSASRDLGATRLQTFTKVELPLAKPGLIIGIMLTFVLTLGSMSESQILGGQTVLMIAHSIDFAFSWQQDWPLGAALSVVLIALVLSAMLWLLSKVDFDSLFRRH